MILINKAEAEVIRKVYPQVKIVRTCTQKNKRHRYYIAEEENYMRLIANTNHDAAEICRRIDEQRQKRRRQRQYRQEKTAQEV